MMKPRHAVSKADLICKGASRKNRKTEKGKK